MPKTLEKSGLAEPEDSPLKRFDLAAGLMCAGVTPVPMDGLSDDEVRTEMEGVAQQDECPYPEPEVVLDPAKQAGVVLALHAGDRGMWERAAKGGLFDQLIGGEE